MLCWCSVVLRLWHLLLISFSFSKWTPLHVAASEGHIEIVQLLLSCNATIDARDFRYFCSTPALLIENAQLLMFCCVAPLTFASHFLFLQQTDPAAHRRLWGSQWNRPAAAVVQRRHRRNMPIKFKIDPKIFDAQIRDINMWV
jgi:hypothetical protein